MRPVGGGIRESGRSEFIGSLFSFAASVYIGVVRSMVVFSKRTTLMGGGRPLLLSGPLYRYVDAITSAVPRMN